MTHDALKLMGKITFILGGARSGKSAHALKIAKALGKRVAFIATAEAKDGEMKRRIRLHKNSRPRHWKTFEEPHDPAAALKEIGSSFDVVIIDCLTLLVSNLIFKGCADAVIKNKTLCLLNTLKKITPHAVIVSNEVGLGIVPENKLAREFRDIAGKINQVTAENADNVFFLVSGIPWRIK